MAPPPAETPENHHDPSLAQSLTRNLHPSFGLHILNHIVQIIPVQMHSFGKVIPQAKVLPFLIPADPGPGLMPPVDGILEMRGHEIAVECRPRRCMDAFEVLGACDPVLEGTVQETDGAVVDLLVGEDLVVPFGERVHHFIVHFIVHVPYCEDHGGHGSSGGDGVLWGDDEVVEAVPEDDETFCVGEQARGMLSWDGETGEGACRIVASEHGAGEGDDVGEAEEGDGCEGGVTIISNILDGDPGWVEAVHGAVDICDNAHVVVGEFELGVAWEDAEEEFVDHRVFNIAGVEDGMFDGGLRNVFKGIDRGKL